MIVPVILSGGSGTRLWPLSREAYPKQFLPLVGENSLFQGTFERLKNMIDVAPPILMCNENHRFLVAEQVRVAGVAVESILLEPVGRNTAPAVACAAIMAQARGPRALLLVLPADHLIRDHAAFQEAVATGVRGAADGKLVTFGIVPQHPETGFGYIRRGKPLATPGLYEVDGFVEKPDRARAEAYVAGGDHYWNSGMFLFRADRYLALLRKLAPEMAEACALACERAVPDLDFVRLDPEAFSACPKDSIDYAVMEKTTDGAVVPLDAGWNDVGSWSALWQVGERDGDGNVVSGDVMLEGVRNCHVHATSRLVAAIGLDDHVLVETDDAVLVAAMDRVQDVKAIVGRLSAGGREEAMRHRRVYRPWGSYECINMANRYQVKRITVNPGAILSLQMHFHRAEHWIVVRGTARVTRGEETFVLGEDQSTYIPLGVKHRLENPGRIPLELIEVQSGSYLGEDDIVRFEDRYGRSESS